MLISIRSSFGACIIIWGRLCRGSLRSQFFLMRLYEIRHRVEAEIIGRKLARHHRRAEPFLRVATIDPAIGRSEEHTSELQSLMRISYAVFCLKKTQTEGKHRAIDSQN